MYTSFYGLNKKPFQISSDPAFMWLGEKHKEALATLKYGILDNKGFLLLTGDVGTGKTTLINALVQSLSEDVICTSVPDPGLEKLDFFNYIGTAFGMDKEFASKGSFLAHFRQFLIQSNETGKKVLLIIDESQLLTQELLEEIRLLSNIEKTDTKLINIFFIGQNEFNEILNQQQNRAVRQRLTLNYNIDPLTPDETTEYIRHRLMIAGTTEPIFDNYANQQIFIYSGGFPRRINIICDHCLLSGYVKEEKTISGDIVRECAKELKIPEKIQHRDINYPALNKPEPAEQPAAPQSPPVQTVQPQVQQFIPAAPVPQPVENSNSMGVISGILLFIGFLIFAFFFMFPDQAARSVQHIRTIISGESVMNTAFDEPAPAPTQPPKSVPVPEKKAVVPSSMQVPENKMTPQHPEKVLDENASTEELEPVAGKSMEKNGAADISQDQVVTKKIIPIQDEQLKQSYPAEKIQIYEEPEPVEPKPLPEEKIIVRFKYNTNDFTQTGYDRLLQFADILMDHPEARILITGYTDSEGYEKYNRKLSEFRANIVRSFFLGRGILPAQIQVNGRGSENPIENNNTAWGRTMNRRVEIEIL